ncbi:diguanylate cyclase response regulator [Desulfonema ishimotonii]|uniref:diguanylate cyclase n=1 Tax=Desulfonema ishimotonii TaxID=45657 RepID=A0A401FT19_9BACT|nr:diguanylate cyclase [Desulfonema ishimotonii]GBC60117.1 diguanylate cyclase response regulator [Desulfonema ishimotonii]
MKGKVVPENLKILVIDDDPFVRAMLGEILESSGYAVATASDGTAGLRRYSDDPEIGMIISDMNMPEMNGLAFVKALRQKDTGMPVIILTVNTEIELALETIRSGANDYLLKDENIEDTILISVQKVLTMYRLEQQNIRLIEDLARKNKELERLSFSDGLTGIPNRRYFDEGGKQEWGRALREQIPLSLIMIDIDDFKSYNDACGHQMGDRCLQQVAHTLQRSLRRFGDFIARYGGEEFAAVLPNTPLNGALAIAETMRSDVMALNLSHPTSAISDRITISIGVSSAVPARNSDLSGLIQQADQALYQAKQTGRNQVAAAGPA